MGQKRHRRSRRHPKKTYRQGSRTKKRVSKKRKSPKKRTKTSIIRNKFKMAGGMDRTVSAEVVGQERGAGMVRTVSTEVVGQERGAAGAVAREDLPNTWWPMTSVLQHRFAEIAEFFEFKGPEGGFAGAACRVLGVSAAAWLLKKVGSTEWADSIIRRGTVGWEFNPRLNILRQPQGGCNGSELQFGLPLIKTPTLPQGVGEDGWQTKGTEWSDCVETEWYHYNNTLKTLFPDPSMEPVTSSKLHLRVKIGVVFRPPPLPDCSLYVRKWAPAEGGGPATRGSLEMATTV